MICPPVSLYQRDLPPPPPPSRPKIGVSGQDFSIYALKNCVLEGKGTFFEICALYYSVDFDRWKTNKVIFPQIVHIAEGTIPKFVPTIIVSFQRIKHLNPLKASPL